MDKKEQERLRGIENSMRLVWDSLQSHLPYVHSHPLVRGETHAFHKKCVKEYLEVLNTLARQL